MNRYDIYFSTKNTEELTGIKFGAAIVIKPTREDDSFLAHYEGFIYSPEGKTFYDKVMCAGGRLHEGYPTIAKQKVSSNELRTALKVGELRVETNNERGRYAAHLNKSIISQIDSVYPEMEFSKNLGAVYVDGAEGFSFFKNNEATAFVEFEAIDQQSAMDLLVRNHVNPSKPEAIKIDMKVRSSGEVKTIWGS